MTTKNTSQDVGETSSCAKDLPSRLGSHMETSPRPDSRVEDLRSIWKEWLISVSKALQPFLKEVIVFAVYIAGDLFVLWLMGFAFVDVAQAYPIIELLYNGLKIASVAVISLHFFVNCFIEIRKERQRTRRKEAEE